MNKYDVDSVKSIVSKMGYELLDEEYQGVKERLNLKDRDGYYYSKSLDQLLIDNVSRRFHTSNPFTLQNLKRWLEFHSPELSLLSDQYQGSDKYLTLIDIEGYYYTAKLRTILNSYPKRFALCNEYTVFNILHWCEINEKNFKLISDEYVNNREKLKWLCLREGCGEVFECNWNNIKSGRGCGYCAGSQVGDSNCLATKYPDIARQWHFIKNGDITPYEVGQGCNLKAWWVCDNNHEWIATVYSRKDGNGCPYCAGMIPSAEYNLMADNPTLCKEWDNNKNADSPFDYTPNSGQYVWWICNDCNHNWEARIVNRNSKSHGCPNCKKYKGESMIADWLCLHDVNYIKNKTYNDLKGFKKRSLSYDFYLPQHNTLIEFQGIQHEQPVDFAGKGFEWAENNYKTQIIRDKKKREYAQRNNITLLEIWYYDIDKISHILSKHILT